MKPVDFFMGLIGILMWISFGSLTSIPVTMVFIAFPLGLRLTVIGVVIFMVAVFFVSSDDFGNKYSWKEVLQTAPIVSLLMLIGATPVAYFLPITLFK